MRFCVALLFLLPVGLSAQGAPPNVVLGQANEEFFRELHRLYSAEGREQALCLYGEVSPGSVSVRLFGAVETKKNDQGDFDHGECEKSSDYLGMAHNHPTVEGSALCGQSPLDVARFAADRKAVLQLIVCDDGIAAFTKPNYLRIATRHQR